MLHNFDDLLNKIFINKDEYKKAYKQRYKLLHKYSENINIEYLQNICDNIMNDIYVYTMNAEITDNYKNEIIGFVVIQKITCESNRLKIFIPLITIHSKLRNNGYATIILDNIIKKYNKIKILEIILLALPSSVDFYIKNGFVISKDSYIEETENTEDSILMKKIIKN
jgi:ribosomal protein S18 acetylase RimI-like enzyme